MLSETERDSLSDILFNIHLAISFAQGFDYERFLTDMRTFYAITRCLEIISEASRRLSPEMKARHPDIPTSLGARCPAPATSTGTITRTWRIALYGAPCRSHYQRCWLWHKPSLRRKSDLKLLC
jgi:hypothetical protein